MVRLKVNELLNRDGKTRYWLYKQLGMSYESFRKMVDNETKSIKYERIEAICVIFNVTPGELFEYDFEISD